MVVKCPDIDAGLWMMWNKWLIGRMNLEFIPGQFHVFTRWWHCNTYSVNVHVSSWFITLHFCFDRHFSNIHVFSFPCVVGPHMHYALCRSMTLWSFGLAKRWLPPWFVRQDGMLRPWTSITLSQTQRTHIGQIILTFWPIRGSCLLDANLSCLNDGFTIFWCFCWQWQTYIYIYSL